MHKTLAICLAVVWTFVGQAFAASVNNPMSEFEERRRTVAALMEAATVWIVAEDDDRITSGTGFLVGDGRIATNAHVFNTLGKNRVVYVLNERIPARKARIVSMVYDRRTGKDFALLSFDPPKNAGLPVLAFNLDAKRMDRVSAWGYPTMITRFDASTEALSKGDTSSLSPAPVVFTEGAVNAIVRSRSGNAILHSAQIAGGNSGGPLINSRGEVVGVNTWGYTEEGEGAFVNAALPANELAVFLRANGVEPKLASGQTIAEGPARTSPPARTPEKTPGKTPGKTDAQKPGAGRDQESRIRDVGSFTVAVPRNWSVLDEEKDAIILGADDDSAAVSIMVDDLEGVDPDLLAREVSRELGGTEPEPDDDGMYRFSFVQDDVRAEAFLVEDGDADKYVLIILFGDTANPAVQEILGSLEDA